MRPWIASLLLAAVACGSSSKPPAALGNNAASSPALTFTDPGLPTDDGSRPAPWHGAVLPAGSVPPVYITEWHAAENMATCPLLVPTWLGEGEHAQPRRADFSGGWAVAYDQPDLCADCKDSAFGVAGVGMPSNDDDDARWGKHVRWSDGSHAGYGLVGDTGPGWLAYMVVKDSGCMYNVWSNISEEHLLKLMASLHHVDAR